MKKLSTLAILLAFSIVCSYGQNQTSPITIKKGFGGYRFYQGSNMLTFKQLIQTMEPNDEAYTEIKGAQSNRTIALLLSSAGGFMIGWPLGTAIGGGDPNWALAGVGAGLVVVSIPISNKSNRQTSQAIETYNRGIASSSFWDNKELSLSMTNNGIGLSLTF